MNLKRVLKIIGGIVIFLTLPSLLLYCFVYFKYNEDLPVGIKGAQAEALTSKMLDALDYKAYQNTNYIEWTFKNRHHYKWEKTNHQCMVYWEDYKVHLNFDDSSKSKAYIHNFEVVGEQAQELINKAIAYFNNDSFWLVAPYKVLDAGTERSLVTLKNGEQALLVTYTSGGSTPGDSYLWHLDTNGQPTSFQMWVSILPIDGLEATWNDWTVTESGAILPTFHKFLIFGLELRDVKGTD